MSEDLPPMGQDVEAILERAGRPSPSSEFEARVMARAMATAAIGVAGATVAKTSAATGVGSATGATLTVKAGAVGLGLFLAGAGAGVALDRTALAPSPPPPEVRVVTKEVRVEVPVEVRVEVPVEVPAPAPPRTAPRLPANDRLLAEERAIIEMGRSALSRREARLALGHCQTHAKRFPAGQLAEERELLWVRALVALGEREEARARASAFTKRFPDSLLAPSVAEAIRAPAP